MEESLPISFSELLAMIFSDKILAAEILWSNNCSVISLLELYNGLNKLLIVFCLFSSPFLRNNISLCRKMMQYDAGWWGIFII